MRTECTAWKGSSRKWYQKKVHFWEMALSWLVSWLLPLPAPASTAHLAGDAGRKQKQKSASHGHDMWRFMEPYHPRGNKRARSLPGKFNIESRRALCHLARGYFVPSLAQPYCSALEAAPRPLARRPAPGSWEGALVRATRAQRGRWDGVPCALGHVACACRVGLWPCCGRVP